MVRKRRQDAQPTKRVIFGLEPSFQLKSQSYCINIVLQKLLMDALTGLPPNCTRIKQFQKYITDNTILMSHKQIKELLSIGNLNSAEFPSSSELLFSLCGKLQIQYVEGNSNKSEAAYIIN